MAEITMTLQEFMTHQGAREAAEKEAASLREQLRAAQLVDPSGLVPDLVRGLRAAREIMPFAMMFIPRWKMPADALKTLADVYEKMPGATEDDRVLAIDWRDFVKEIADHNERASR